MVRTSAPNSVAGQFVDRNPATSTPGTQIQAADLNMWMEEIAGAVENAGLTLSGADNRQLYKALRALSHGVGELVFNMLALAPSVDWPAYRIDEADVTILAANAPQLVTALRAEKLSVLGSSSFACTVSGSNVVFPTGTAAAAILAALLDDALVHGGGRETVSYTNWRTLTIGSTDYAITGITLATRTVAVSGTPPTGAQTVSVYPHRVAGSTTSARFYKAGGRALVAHGDTANELVSGMRRRDRMQGHDHEVFGTAGTGGSVNAVVITASGGAPAPTQTAWDAVRGFSDDYSANGTPRTGDTTDPRALAGYLYIWAGVYVA